MQNDKSSAYLIAFDDSGVTDKKPIYFFIPPKFAFSQKLNILIFPLVAFYLRGFCVNSPNSVFCYRLFSYLCNKITNKR